MIHIYSIISGLNYVELNWTHPKFLPQKYQLKYMFTMKARRTSKNVKKKRRMTRTKNLRYDTTSTRISDLCPSSNYTLILVAVYNPASIDSGIKIEGCTLDEATRKSDLSLGDFIIKLGYCLCVRKYMQRHSPHPLQPTKKKSHILGCLGPGVGT